MIQESGLALEMLSRIEDVYRMCFLDESKCYVCGTVNKPNCLWGNANPHDVIEHECDSPKASVWCAFTRNKVIGLFSFEKTYHDW
jgi:hypothetical protein